MTCTAKRSCFQMFSFQETPLEMSFMQEISYEMITKLEGNLHIRMYHLTFNLCGIIPLKQKLQLYVSPDF